MTTKHERAVRDANRRRHEQRVDDLLDDAEALVGPLRARRGWPETALGEAAKRLRGEDQCSATRSVGSPALSA